MLRLMLVATGLVAMAAGFLSASSVQEPGLRDGVKVHGAWAIEIRNDDGSLAGRHEFQNALTPLGQQVLASLLGGDVTATRRFWAVQVDGGSCREGDSICWLSEEPGREGDGVLTVELVGSPDPTGVRLRATGTAHHDGSIFRVATYQVGNGAGGGRFSSRVLPVQIPIVAGQSISVTVVISFS